MPYAPLKPCSNHGCPLFRKPGSMFCETHTVADDAADRDRRGSSSERGYDYQWGKIRLMKLRQNPICETPGCGHASEEVHHLDGNSLNRAQENLQALCKRHHSAIKDKGEIGYRGGK